MTSNRLHRRALLSGAAAVTAAMAAGPALAAPPVPTRIVRTSNGPVQGLVRDGLQVFKGVRYGAPPIGPLRFKPPQKPRPWTATETALGYGAPAIQLSGGGSVNPPNDLAFLITEIFDTASDMKIDNEDCLFLNVWTKGLSDGAKRPVMVWLHGGGYSSGSGHWPVYEGSNLARRGDVVVITVNHRLNAFGYLDLSEIGGAPYAQSGNAGILDLVLVLEWVRDNAAAFGGDPGNVTIFGESGGGAKVSTLLGMPAAKGLFHKAIIQSGPGVNVMEPAVSRRNAKAILAELGMGPGNLAGLETVHPDAIIAAIGAAAVKIGGGPGQGLQLAPVLEAGSIPRHPFAPDANPVSADVPILIGWNKDEMSLFNTSAPWWGRMTEADLATQMQGLAGPKAAPLTAALKAEFPDYPPYLIFNAAMSTMFMMADSVRIAERKSAQGRAPAYMYNLVWDTPAVMGALKSPHALDLPFVFDNVARSEGFVGSGPVPQALADQMAGAWIAFARTGNPHHAGLPAWPAYDPRRRAAMIFDATPRLAEDPVGRVRQVLHG